MNRRFACAFDDFINDLAPVVDLVHFMNDVFQFADFANIRILKNGRKIAILELLLVEGLDIKSTESAVGAISKLCPAIIETEKENRMPFETNIVGDIVDQPLFYPEDGMPPRT